MPVRKILAKLFVTRFYVQHTGFFLLLFYLFFGVVSGGVLQYHYLLLKGIVGSANMLLLALLLWALYNLKCALFTLKTLTAPEYAFLYQTMGSMATPQRRRIWLGLHAGMYAPALVYSMAAVIVGVFSGAYIAAIAIVLFNVLMSIAPLWWYDHALLHPGAEFFLQRWQHWLHRRLHKPLPLYYLYELLADGLRPALLVKAASGLVLVLTFALMEVYDVRAVLTGWLICLTLHSVLIFAHRRFDDRYLAFARNLPLTRRKRYGMLCITYGCLLLPEYILLLARTWRQGWLHGLLFAAFGVSLLLLFRCILYFPRLDQDRYLRWVFVLFVLLLFLTLAHWYWPAVAGMQAAAMLLFAVRYYRYEPAYESLKFDV